MTSLTCRSTSFLFYVFHLQWGAPGRWVVASATRHQHQLTGRHPVLAPPDCPPQVQPPLSRRRNLQRQRRNLQRRRRNLQRRRRNLQRRRQRQRQELQGEAMAQHPHQVFLNEVRNFVLIWTGSRDRMSKYLTGRFFGIFFPYVLYSKLLHLPPLIFHCVGGCWDRTQGTVATSALAVRSSNHSTRSHGWIQNT